MSSLTLQDWPSIVDVAHAVAGSFLYHAMCME